MKYYIGVAVAFMPWVLMIGIWIGYGIGRSSVVSSVPNTSAFVLPTSTELPLRTIPTSEPTLTPVIPTVMPTDIPAPTVIVPTETAAPIEPTATIEQPTNTAVPAQTSYGVNQDVHVGDVRWKVLEATNVGNTLAKGDTSKGDFAPEAKTNGTYIGLRLEVENLSKDQLSFTSVDLTDDQGRTFKSTSDFNALSHIPTAEHCTLETLNPNLPRTCQMFFEIPTTAKGLHASVGDLKMFGEDARIDLGF